jgi:hypothetical protein
MRRTFAGLLLAGALGSLVIGCGGGSEPTTEGAESSAPTTPTEPQPKQAFIKQADAICEEEDKQIEEGARQVQGQPSPQEQFATETVIPGIQQQIDGVRALPPPEGKEAEAAEFLDTAQRELDAAKRDPAAFAQVQGEGYFKESAKAAKKVGLKKCAQ